MSIQQWTYGSIFRMKLDERKFCYGILLHKPYAAFFRKIATRIDEPLHENDLQRSDFFLSHAYSATLSPEAHGKNAEKLLY
jgi:hypothetical protein